MGADPPTADLVTFGPAQPLFTWAPGYALAPGDSVVFTFDVEVGVDVEPLEVLSNTIQADWQSLPGATTALNTGGTIGPDGSPTGLRNGALPNAGDALNDYEFETDDSVAVPPIAIVKTDLDPSVLPEIGRHRQFELELLLPRASTETW